MKQITSLLTAMIIAGGIAWAAPASAAEDVVIVYDASGSMWGQIDGVSKIEIARKVMNDMLHKWPEDTNLGLVAYGHRRKGDCSDIETLIKPGPLDQAAFIKTVNGITPNGKTPISASLQHAADLLSYRDSQATIVLISDGLETCNADPCALSEQLAKQGLKLTAHVVGFDLETEAHANLSCIAENTGGIFVPANNAAELHAALDQVQSTLEQKPAAPVPKPEPVPEQKPKTSEVEITAPAQASTGASFDVNWSKTIHGSDFITIVPAGADEGARNNHIRAHDKNSGKLTAPAEPGLYEVRYVLEEGKKTIGKAPIEVIEAGVELTAPAQVSTGASFDVNWSKIIHGSDFITIVPAGADEGARNNHIRARDKNSGKLTAPAEPGLYEVRYVLEEGKKTIGKTPIEVIEAGVELTAPAQVSTGASLDVNWSKTIHGSDFITIVPAGADEGARNNHIRARDKNSGKLTAPAEPGLYEIRYVLEEGKKTIGKTPIEVTMPDINITGPSTVRAGTNVDIVWSSTVHSSDYITIVPAGSDEGTRNTHLRARDKTEARLKAPSEPGLYEIRYVLEEGKKMLASAPLEVVEADAPLDDGAGLSVPKTAATGETITISWSTDQSSADQRISIARKNQPDFSWISVQSVGEEKTMQLTMPDEAGFYEVRFLDIAGRVLLGRSIVEVK